MFSVIGFWGFAGGQQEGDAGDKEVVKVAFIGPLTGKFSKMGLGARNSFQLAIDQQNASGANAYYYEVETFDDECVPAKGVQVVTKAGSDPELIAAASHYCSMVAITTADVFHKFNLPNIVWGAVLPDITYGNEYVETNRVNGTMVQQNQYNARMMVNDLGFQSFAIIHDTTDYGQGHKEYFVETLEELGVEPLSVHGVSIEQKDYTAILTQIKSQEPEVVYFGGLTAQGVLIKRQMDKLGLKAQFIGTSGIKSLDFNDALGENAEGTLCFLEGAPLEQMPGGQDFKQAYEEAGYSEPWEAYGPFAYCAANIIVESIEEVGPDRQKVAQAIENYKGEDIIGGIEMNEYGQNVIPLITGYVSQDGEWVPWEDSAYAAGDRTLPGIAYKESGSWNNPYQGD
jgi:branched-chain amino acid transport system substrate-binding protein